MFNLVEPETGVVMACGTGTEPGHVIISMGHVGDPEPAASVTLGQVDAMDLADWIRAAAGGD